MSFLTSSRAARTGLPRPPRRRRLSLRALTAPGRPARLGAQRRAPETLTTLTARAMPGSTQPAGGRGGPEALPTSLGPGPEDRAPTADGNGRAASCPPSRARLRAPALPDQARPPAKPSDPRMGNRSRPWAEGLPPPHFAMYRAQPRADVFSPPSDTRRSAPPRRPDRWC
jgi:hypothetical protein